MRQESLEFLQEIVNTPSPSGHEQGAARAFRRYVQPFVDDLRTDVHGNTYAIMNPDAETRVMLAGHIDEIGFIVHYISEEGLLFFKGVGGHDSCVPVGQRVWVHGPSQIPGVIGRKPIHLLEDDDEAGKKAPKLHDLWIDIGTTSRAESLRLAPLGSPVTYQDEFQLLQDGRAVARGFDNKMGAFVVAEALRWIAEKGGPRDGVGIYGVATVQEEIGFRGATTASYNIHAQAGIAVDVSHATDFPGINKEKHGELLLGKGPSITRGAFASPSLCDLLEELAGDEGIPLQVEIAADCTGTDATPMQVSRSGMAVGVLGVPLRYMHTPCEMLCLNDVEDAARLMAAFCLRMSHDTDFTPM
jgi:endoglucanase